MLFLCVTCWFSSTLFFPCYNQILGKNQFRSGCVLAHNLRIHTVRWEGTVGRIMRLFVHICISQSGSKERGIQAPCLLFSPPPPPFLFKSPAHRIVLPYIRWVVPPQSTFSLKAYTQKHASNWEDILTGILSSVLWPRGRIEFLVVKTALLEDLGSIPSTH